MFHFQARYFKSKKEKGVVFFLSGWRVQWHFYYPVVKMLTLYGYSCYLYSYTNNILSSDTEKTVERFHTVEKDILKKINNLSEKQKENVSLLGVSLGTVLACMVSNKSKIVKKIILVATGSDAAATIWSWDKVFRPFKKELLKKNISLPLLQKKWETLHPKNNLDNMQEKHVLFYASKNDEVIPRVLSWELYEIMKKKKIQVEYRELSQKHIPSCILALLKYRRNVAFLKSNL